MALLLQSQQSVHDLPRGLVFKLPTGRALLSGLPLVTAAAPFTLTDFLGAPKECLLSLDSLCKCFHVLAAGYAPAYGAQAKAAGYTLFGTQPTVYFNQRRLLAYGSQTGGSYVGSYAAYAPAAYAPAAYAPAAYAPAAYASDTATLAAPIPLAALSQVLANPAAGPVARSFAAAAGAVGATAVGTAVGMGESWLAVLTVAKLAPLLGLPSSTPYLYLPPCASGGLLCTINLTGARLCCHQTAQLPAHLSTG